MRRSMTCDNCRHLRPGHEHYQPCEECSVLPRDVLWEPRTRADRARQAAMRVRAEATRALLSGEIGHEEYMARKDRAWAKAGERSQP